MNKKINVAILGTGNIGSDLLKKIQRSDLLECSLFAGVNVESDGIKRAQSMGVRTSGNSIRAIEDDPDCCQIVFDATSARAHMEHAPIIKKLGKYAIDLTPSRVGEMCIPVLNIGRALEMNNVNMVTCGGQASVPIAAAIMNAHPDTKYIEVVASIASRSAGPGTRNNIDEYTQTTQDAIKSFSGVPNAKAIIVLNPAEPPILMRNTIYALIDKPNIEKLDREIKMISERIRRYVPGYRIVLGPIVDKNRVTVMVEVTGHGDYLPKYAGNLDIITCAAVQVAEEYARTKLL